MNEWRQYVTSRSCHEELKFSPNLCTLNHSYLFQMESPIFRSNFHVFETAYKWAQLSAFGSAKTSHSVSFVRLSLDPVFVRRQTNVCDFSTIRFRFMFQMKTIIRTSLKDPQCRLVEVYTNRAPVQGRAVGNLMDSLLTVTSLISSIDNLLKF